MVSRRDLLKGALAAAVTPLAGRLPALLPGAIGLTTPPVMAPVLAAWDPVRAWILANASGSHCKHFLWLGAHGLQKHRDHPEYPQVFKAQGDLLAKVGISIRSGEVNMGNTHESWLAWMESTYSRHETELAIGMHIPDDKWTDKGSNRPTKIWER